MKKNSQSAAKRRYEQPRLSRVLLIPQEEMLLPSSWNPGHGEDNLPIIDGDPEGDGKGSKSSGRFWDDEV